MDPPAAALPPQRRRRGARSVEWTLIFTISFSILSLLKLEPLARNSVQGHKSEIDLPHLEEGDNSPTVQLQNKIENPPLGGGGVGLVTTDGQWDISVSAKYDIKILGFTDKNYVPIAKVWYERLTKLGYKEHYIVANEKEAYDDLMRQNYRVLPCFFVNPDYGHLVTGLFKQIMALRVKFVRDLVKNGTHVLLTDIDNVFSRHVDPVGFVEEGYDVYHAYEMRYPTNLYRKHGFVFCSGHLFFRSSEATLRFLDMAVKRCGDKCDDQVMYNGLFWELDIEWDGGDPPAHPEAIRVVSHTADKTNAGLLVESATGRSRLTNHTFKIWDRDFAWRLSGGLPELCPSKNNWLGMPSVNNGQTDKIQLKLALFDLWDDYCLNPEADKKRVRLACNTSIADCELCKSPMCKACWIPNHNSQEERTCMIMDANIAENPFHVKDDWVALSDGSTVKFCGSNKWGNKSGAGGITCNKRVQYVIKRHHMSEQDAKISVLENGCSCSVGVKGKKSISRKGRDREEEYLQQFATRKKHFQDISLLPAKTIAQRYDIPETSRSVKCLLNGTTHIGWIPRAKGAEQSQVLIPRLIFQSWKTNHLTYNVCQNVLAWTKLNPEYDYMLFDDKAADLFIQKEYGNDIFDSFDCVNVGAARCDVWRLMIIYIFGGIYFDIDVRPKSAFRFWGFGNRTVVTGRGCNNRRHPTGCAHQWGLIYVPFHEVIQNAIEETLGNLAKKDATHVYGVSFWSFYNAWTKGPFNSSYMPGWGEYMGDRVTFSQEEAKAEMISLNGHWPAANGKKDKIWKSECLS